VRVLATRDPSIVECWDAQYQRVYYFHKRTGKSGWVVEDLVAEAAAATQASGPTSDGMAAQPPGLDLASFLTHGYSKPKEPVKKKQKVAPKAKAEPGPGGAKDESDLSREERKRWADWNEGGGGYTEMFFNKYKNCQSNPGKPKEDKRLKGSVGPGQGMEYMARWTGSKNSFN